MIETLLVLDTGSSVLKFQVFASDNLTVLMRGKVSGIGTRAALEASVEGSDEVIKDILASSGHDAALLAVLNLIDRHDDGWKIMAVVHRVVHGGQQFVEPVIVTPAILSKLEALIPLAPLHQPYNLAGIEASHELAVHAADIACFDTAFHAQQDPLFTTFAIEAELRDKGVRKYGSHGISYEWISSVLAKDHPRLASGRVVAAHLGNGASLCAIRDGRSVDTTMGMTALDGLPMGTRSGAIDPGAVTFMLRELGMGAIDVEDMLYERSGLKGLSGISGDVETLLASSDPRAAFALDYFALKVAQYAAMMATSMGGIDALVFTGGIGENAAPVREAIIKRLAFLGGFKTIVIPSNEELMMALHARELLRSRS
ncbi:acetate/propionate family kinase [Rhizobium sp. TH2]|uniref:acetate/propionate family kinase n=1 Tax=Rhizobium sp. TH2 TaxID=2775403 RepID=UPI002157740F|nr:acetate/propionate family kinase [Rhizobium sp. TH2]UVC07909.1 acetate/propionate family kinase [Rhizobium sp. TH2]